MRSDEKYKMCSLIGDSRWRIEECDALIIEYRVLSMFFINMETYTTTRKLWTQLWLVLILTYINARILYKEDEYKFPDGEIYYHGESQFLGRLYSGKGHHVGGTKLIISMSSVKIHQSTILSINDCRHKKIETRKPLFH